MWHAATRSGQHIQGLLSLRIFDGFTVSALAHHMTARAITALMTAGTPFKTYLKHFNMQNFSSSFHTVIKLKKIIP
jgi:hypothetical protein